MFSHHDVIESMKIVVAANAEHSTALPSTLPYQVLKQEITPENNTDNDDLIIKTNTKTRNLKKFSIKSRECKILLSNESINQTNNELRTNFSGLGLIDPEKKNSNSHKQTKKKEKKMKNLNYNLEEEKKIHSMCTHYTVQQLEKDKNENETRFQKRHLKTQK